jgi:hypothetical protein
VALASWWAILILASSVLVAVVWDRRVR